MEKLEHRSRLRQIVSDEAKPSDLVSSVVRPSNSGLDNASPAAKDRHIIKTGNRFRDRPSKLDASRSDTTLHLYVGFQDVICGGVLVVF